MKNIEKYLIALYFFICPLEMALNILFGSTAKYVGLLILVTWIVKFFFRSEKLVDINYQMMEILLWLIMCVMSSLLWGRYSNYTVEYITTYLQMVLLVFICQDEIWESKEISVYTFAYWVGSIITALLVILFGDARYNGRETILLFGRYCDPNQIAANILPGACISFWMMSKIDSKQSHSLICLCALVASSYSVLLTGSRGGFLGLLASLGVLIMAGLSKREIKFQYILITILIILFVTKLAPSLFNMRVFDFDSYTDTYSNGGNRITIWQTLLKSFDAQWLIGHGVGSSIAYFYEIYGHVTGVHNTYLLVLYETGIIGLFFFLYPFFSMIAYHLKRGNNLFAGLIIAALTCAFFLDALNLRYIWNGLMLAIMKYNSEAVINMDKRMKSAYKYIRQI